MNSKNREKKGEHENKIKKRLHRCIGRKSPPSGRAGGTFVLALSS